jgi:hypothetical protein
MQTSQPVPRKASDSAGQATAHVKTQGQPNQATPLPAQASGEANGNRPAKSYSTQKDSDDPSQAVRVTEIPDVTVKPAKRDAADWAYWVFNFLLVAVGILQVVLLCWTFRAVRHQARESTRQRVTMRRQLTAMQGQLVQMENAGKQTDNLIDKTGVAAEAARKSADAFVKSERAWIQVIVSKPPSVWQETGKPEKLRAWVTPDIMNVGRTPAKITKMVVVPFVIHTPLGPLEKMPPELPPEPIYGGQGAVAVERDAILAQNTGINPISVEIPKEDFLEVVQRNAVLYIYGYVDYLDILNDPHETRFCCLYMG